MIRVCDCEAVSLVGGLVTVPGKSIRKIVIVGVPRSGNTLLATMLGQHPSIALAQDALSERIADFVEHLTIRFDRRTEETISPYWNQEISVDARLNEVIGEANSTQESVRQILNESIDSAALNLGADFFVDKCPPAIEYLPSLRTLFPDLISIQIIRDPRATAKSLVERHYMSWLGAAELWERWNRIGLSHRDLVGSQHLIVSFEDLVLDPESTMQALCDQIGVEFHPSMTQISDSPLTRLPNAYVGSTIESEKANAWRQSLRRKTIKRIEQVCGALMEHLDMERDFPNLTVRRPNGMSLVLNQIGNSARLLFHPNRTVMSRGQLVSARISLVKRLSALGSSLARGLFSEPLVETMIRSRSRSERRNELDLDRSSKSR